MSAAIELYKQVTVYAHENWHELAARYDLSLILNCGILEAGMDELLSDFEADPGCSWGMRPGVFRARLAELARGFLVGTEQCGMFDGVRREGVVGRVRDCTVLYVSLLIPDQVHELARSDPTVLCADPLDEVFAGFRSVLDCGVGVMKADMGAATAAGTCAAARIFSPCLRGIVDR